MKSLNVSAIPFREVSWLRWASPNVRGIVMLGMAIGSMLSSVGYAADNFFTVTVGKNANEVQEGEDPVGWKAKIYPDENTEFKFSRDEEQTKLIGVPFATLTIETVNGAVNLISDEIPIPKSGDYTFHLDFKIETFSGLDIGFLRRPPSPAPEDGDANIVVVEHPNGVNRYPSLETVAVTKAAFPPGEFHGIDLELKVPEGVSAIQVTMSVRYVEGGGNTFTFGNIKLEPAE